MAKKKSSESRKHAALVRMDEKTRERAMLAANLMRMSLADYVTDVVSKQAERDILREAKKLAGGESKS